MIVQPGNSIAGQYVTVQVQALDQYSNIATSESRKVSLLVNGATRSDITLASGIGSTSIRLTKSGLVSLSLADNFATGLQVSSTSTFTYAPASPAKFVLPTATSGTVDAPIIIPVECQDTYGNVVTTYSGSARVVAFGSAIVANSGSVTFSLGVASTSVTYTLPAVVSLGLVDSAATGLDVSSANTATFAPGATVKFIILSPPSGATVDNAVTITLQALDQFGNVATAESRAVTLDATNSVTGVGLVTFVSGVGLKSIRDHVAEASLLTLIDSQGTHADVSSNRSISFASGMFCNKLFPHLTCLRNPSILRHCASSCSDGR